MGTTFRCNFRYIVIHFDRTSLLGSLMQMSNLTHRNSTCRQLAMEELASAELEGLVVLEVKVVVAEGKEVQAGQDQAACVHGQLVALQRSQTTCQLLVLLVHYYAFQANLQMHTWNRSEGKPSRLAESDCNHPIHQVSSTRSKHRQVIDSPSLLLKRYQLQHCVDCTNFCNQFSYHRHHFGRYL